MADDDSIGMTAGQQPQDYKCTAIGIEPPRDTTTVTHYTMDDDPLTSKDTAFWTFLPLGTDPTTSEDSP